jgi:hypothetical protein
MTHRRVHPLPPGQMPDRLDQGSPRPVPLLTGVEGEDLALPPVPPRHIREHAEQSPPGGLGDKRRMIQRADEFSQAGHPQTVVPGKKLLGRRLVGGHPRTNVHRTNVTSMEERAIVLLPREESRYRRGSPPIDGAIYRAADVNVRAMLSTLFDERVSGLLW